MKRSHRQPVEPKGKNKSRREFMADLAKCSKMAAALAVLGPSVVAPDGHASTRPPRFKRAAPLTLTGWTSPSAVSDVFVITNVPAPVCSLAGGVLPGGACDAATAFKDDGVDALITRMSRLGTRFYKTATQSGVMGANDVVVIKVNNQWGGAGGDQNQGRLSTNTDVLKGLIWRILEHPSGFTGEIVVTENTQDVCGFDVTPANAQDQGQTFQDVVNAFASSGYPVSLYLWDDLNSTRVSGGSVDAAGYPAGEYIHDHNTDAYILLEDPAGTGTNEYSYPKFQTDGGTYVSMRYGVWNGSSYDSDRLTFINLPVLKCHCMAGATICWKNLIGFITIANNESRFTSWDNMHNFFWGYNGVMTYGLIGRQMARVRTPDLHIIDAVWVAVESNYYGNAERQDILLAGTDPFALDWYASEYLLYPLLNDQNCSAARAGAFRNATRVNQKSAAGLWSGTYPYMQLLAGYDENVPSTDERNQLNVYVARADQVRPATAAPYLNLLLD
jgi:hypothetical protein